MVRRAHISDEQKIILHRFMDQNPKLKQGKFSPDFTHDTAQRLWIKIAVKLNSIPGAQKIWSQWRKIWQDYETNLRKSEQKRSAAVRVPPVKVSSEVISDTDNSKDGTADVRVKRRRAKNMTRMQKKLLYKLVNRNDKINRGKIETDNSVTYDIKHKEWKRIAAKLNSTIGPQKTWSQWKKCWHDIRKYYFQDEKEIERACNNSSDDDFDGASKETDNRINNIVSAAQLNYIVKEISERSEAKAMLPYIWFSLCTKLNRLGPSSKSTLEWRNVWFDYKLKVKKLVDQYGYDKCNYLQQWTYRIMTQESDRDLNRPIETVLTENRLQIPNGIAEQECNIIGSLVALKLRSMQKEQKLIAEKLISEILFQGQMEMFQYSDEPVSIPGYT